MVEQIVDAVTLIEVVKYMVAGIAVVVASMFIFNFFTPYNEIEEIRSGGPYGKGNKAVAWDYGAKILATCKIVATAIFTSKGILSVIIWGFIGIAMLVVTFEIFERFMKDDKHEALQGGNESRGMFSAAISIGIMLLICSVIS